MANHQPPRTNSRRTTIVLDPDVMTALKKESTKQDRTLSGLISYICRTWSIQQRRKENRLKKKLEKEKQQQALSA